MPHETLAWNRPESLGSSFCLIRVGLIAHRWRALPWAWRLSRRLDRITRDANRKPPGLLRSEPIRISWNHFGFLQYWASVDELLAWAHSEPHTDVWRKALERQRTRQDFAIYHETFVVSESGFEAIYMNPEETRPGASSFGDMRPPKGAAATARGRLGGISAVDVSGASAKIEPGRTF
jgi:hypothetical protein